MPVEIRQPADFSRIKDIRYGTLRHRDGTTETFANYIPKLEFLRIRLLPIEK